MPTSSVTSPATGASLALLLLAAGAALLPACSGDDGPDPMFPADYAATYEEVRDCRRSIDHDFKHIRILAAPEALEAYTGRVVAFPVGAVVLKEQYADNDAACTSEPVDYTVMVKLESGASPDTIDWSFQQVQADRTTVDDVDVLRCARCHEPCGEPPEGYLGTCAAP